MASYAFEIEIPDLTGFSFRIDDEILLRPVVQTDAEAVFIAVRANAQRLIEYMHWMTPDYSIEMANEFVEHSNAVAATGESLSLGIFRDGVFIGAIGFVYFDRKVRKTEIGYWIDSAAEGNGIISTATRVLIDFAFEKLSMNRIEIRCATRNVRSAAVPRRMGFTEEARLRESEIRNGKLQDFYVFGLLRAEWEKNKNA